MIMPTACKSVKMQNAWDENKLLPFLLDGVLSELKCMVYNPVTLIAVCKLNGSNAVSRTIAEMIKFSNSK